MKIAGVVEKIYARHVQGRRGAMTFYSVKIGGVDDWIGVGKDQPAFKEGDYVEGSAEKNARGYFDAEDLRVVQGPQPTPAPPSTTSVSQLPSAADSRQQSIILQHSQEMAIRAAGVLLAHDAVPYTKAATKAATAKRFEELVAVIDKLTVKYFHDASTGRLLDVVADMGVVDQTAEEELPFDADPAPAATAEDDD